MLDLVEGTANMLRGMCMDPAIPQHAKQALSSRVELLEQAVEAATEAASASIQVLCYWADGRCQEMEFHSWPQRSELPADAVRFDIAWPDLKA